VPHLSTTNASLPAALSLRHTARQVPDEKWGPRARAQSCREVRGAAGAFGAAAHAGAARTACGTRRPTGGAASGRRRAATGGSCAHPSERGDGTGCRADEEGKQAGRRQLSTAVRISQAPPLAEHGSSRDAHAHASHRHAAAPRAPAAARMQRTELRAARVAADAGGGGLRSQAPTRALNTRNTTAAPQPLSDAPPADAPCRVRERAQVVLRDETASCMAQQACKRALLTQPCCRGISSQLVGDMRRSATKKEPVQVELTRLSQSNNAASAAAAGCVVSRGACSDAPQLTRAAATSASARCRWRRTSAPRSQRT
jgi:hypothetical protein